MKTGEPASFDQIALGPTPTRAEAERLITALLQRWRAGEPADVERALTEHPELLGEKALLLELIHEASNLRTQAGAAIDPEAFREQFPDVPSSIHKLLAAAWFFETYPELFDAMENEAANQPAPPPIPWPREGETFLGFRLMHLLGYGQFGRAFLACQEAMGNRMVVVKVARQGAGEANILGRLIHPNIVPVHSVHHDQATGLTAVCMPYLGSATLEAVMAQLFAGSQLPVAGQALRQAIRDAAPEAIPEEGQDTTVPRPLGSYVEEVVHLGRQLAEALALAHARGVYHGDLKPANVLLTPKGRAMLLDFNLSFDFRKNAPVVGGTVPYMSPEQLRAFIASQTGGLQFVDRHSKQPLDGRSDLFALGVLLYELLTMTHPFVDGRFVSRPHQSRPEPLPTISIGRSSHEKEQARKQAVVQQCLLQLERQNLGLPPARQANPQLDPVLVSILERCLAREPDARFPNAAELGAALGNYLSGPQRLRRWVARRRRSLLTAGVLVACLVAATTVAWSLRPPYSLRQLNSGWAAYQRGDYQQALVYFHQATEADPQLAEAFFARARTYQQLGNLQKALAEYEQAAPLASDGRILACRACCQAALGNYRSAMIYFSQAIEAGFDTAEVLNNLGYCSLKRNDLRAAQQYLDQALARQPRLQAAYHNRLKVHARRGLRPSERIPASWLADLDQALSLGPASADLYLDAARLYALAARADRQWIEPALACLEKCVACRQLPQPSLKDTTFSALQAEAGFQDLLKRLPSPLLPDRILSLLDPLTGEPVVLR